MGVNDVRELRIEQLSVCVALLKLMLEKAALETRLEQSTLNAAEMALIENFRKCQPEVQNALVVMTKASVC